METTTGYEGASWVLEAVMEWVDSNPDDSQDELVSELFTSEDNYNNADRTSVQVVFTEDALKAEIETALEFLRKSAHRCSGCGKLITEEEYVGANEHRTSDPYPMYEYVVYGYKCDFCGEEEDY